MAETSDPLLREIEDDLREEKFAKLWKQYGSILAAAVVALVVGVGGFQWWTGYTTDQRLETGRKFDSAEELARNGDVVSARSAFETLAAEADGGYALIATLRKAQLLADEGNIAAARTAYRAIATDTAVDEIYRDIATVRAVIAGMQIGTDDQALQSELASLMAETNHMRFVARELSALIDIEAGDIASARSTLDSLAVDALAPNGLRERATAIVSTLPKSGS